MIDRLIALLCWLCFPISDTDTCFVPSDGLIASADYHHVEEQLLEKQYRNYDEKYWEKKTFAPSSLIYYIGVNKKIAKLNLEKPVTAARN